MANASKAKGYRGEVEVLELLQTRLNRVYQVRNLPFIELSRSPHQRDIVGVSWLAPEVKRVENDSPCNVASWWEQCKSQAKEGQYPVLFYRKNKRPWTIRMFGHLACGQMRVTCPVDISLEAFMTWFELEINARLNR